MPRALSCSSLIVFLITVLGSSKHNCFIDANRSSGNTACFIQIKTEPLQSLKIAVDHVNETDAEQLAGGVLISSETSTKESTDQQQAMPPSDDGPLDIGNFDRPVEDLPNQAPAHVSPAPVDSLVTNVYPAFQPEYQAQDDTTDIFTPYDHTDEGEVAELHLPAVTLGQLHVSAHGSLARFLLDLRQELGRVLQIDERRLSVLGIYGRYRRVMVDEAMQLQTEEAESNVLKEAVTSFALMDQEGEPNRVGEEVVVKLEVLPGKFGDPGPAGVLQDLEEKLQDRTSSLMQGPMRETLADGSLVIISQPEMTPGDTITEREGMARLSAMALPIGISAAFTGILIWLAA